MLEKETRFKTTDTRVNRLEQTINLFSRAPMLNVHDDLVPMNECSCDETWGQSIGFEMSPHCILSIPKKMR